MGVGWEDTENGQCLGEQATFSSSGQHALWLSRVAPLELGAGTGDKERRASWVSTEKGGAVCMQPAYLGFQQWVEPESSSRVISQDMVTRGGVAVEGRLGGH